MDKVAEAAFYDELEKLAFWEKVLPIIQKLTTKLAPMGKGFANFDKYISGAIDAHAAGNLGNYVRSFKTPNIIKDINGVTTAATPEYSGSLQKHIGDAANRLHEWGSGNFIKETKQAFNDANYKIIPSSSNIIDVDGKKYFKSWGFKLPVQGKAADGNLIVRRSLPGRLFQKSMTPQGMAIQGIATGMLFGEPAKDNIPNSLTESAKWIFEPYGQIDAAVGIAKSLF